MPVPRNTTAIPSAPLAPEAHYDSKVTELRIHGVGGTPPDALLCDLAPAQVGGDRIAGFYRTCDYQVQGRGAWGRHVECYSWSGLTSRSKSRVLWLALLAFLLGNLAGWMCSPKTRETPWRFALHRACAALASLALTINAALVAVMITADVLAYQTVRGGLAGSQWWLKPLQWPGFAAHPARQILVGVAVPGVFILILELLARTSRKRYEAVHPPFKGAAEPDPRPVAAAALREGGLRDGRFWAGEPSVRLLAHLHIAAAVGFLAIVLGVTVHALMATQAQWIAWWLIAMYAGAAAMAIAVAYLCADALGGFDRAGQIADGLRVWVVRLAVILSGTAIVSAGVFAWLQPGGTPEKAAGLPGMPAVITWTAAGIGVPVAVLGVQVLAGAARERAGARDRLFGGPLVALALAFSVLNVVMLGVLIWMAHIVGPVTTDSVIATAASPGQIYLPYEITFGIPMVALAAVAAAIIFAVAELGRWLSAPPVDDLESYRNQARQKLLQIQDPALRLWDWSALSFPAPARTPAVAGSVLPDPAMDQAPDPPSSLAAKNWPRMIGRARWLGRAPHDAAWLLWGIVVVQLAAVLCTWQFRWDPPAGIRYAGTFAAVTLLTPLIAYVYSAWSRPDRRRRIAVLWDVGTFWPRSYHPFSPPSYAERAVPELQRRMWWLHDHHGPVVLVAHSQGAMLAVAALVQRAHRPDDDHVALVTFGAPICKLYGWAFPAYITPDLLTAIAPDGSNWVNAYYPTDPIGGKVTLTQHTDTVNVLLPDPAECSYIYGQPLPAPQGHSGYWADQRVLNRINDFTANLSIIGGRPTGSERRLTGEPPGRGAGGGRHRGAGKGVPGLQNGEPEFHHRRHGQRLSRRPARRGAAKTRRD